MRSYFVACLSCGADATAWCNLQAFTMEMPRHAQQAGSPLVVESVQVLAEYKGRHPLHSRIEVEQLELVNGLDGQVEADAIEN
eukprot:3749448-Amphidinium_carterae.2